MVVSGKRVLHVVAGTDTVSGHNMASPAAQSDAEIKRDIQELHRAWAQELMRLTRLAPSPLATSAGLSDTTISRLYDTDYAGSLSALSIYKLCKTYNVPGPEAFEAAGRRFATGYVEAEPFEAAAHPELVPAVTALIGERPGIQPMILRTYTLEGARFGPGDVVLLDRTATPRDGDVVCARVGEGTEVWRVFRGNYLLDECIDPKDRGLPLFVDNRVVPLGAVRGMIRPPA